jgi:hypothetical protein
MIILRFSILLMVGSEPSKLARFLMFTHCNYKLFKQVLAVCRIRFPFSFFYAFILLSKIMGSKDCVYALKSPKDRVFSGIIRLIRSPSSLCCPK